MVSDAYFRPGMVKNQLVARTCPNCGAPVEEGAGSCGYCGSQFPNYAWMLQQPNDWERKIIALLKGNTGILNHPDGIQNRPSNVYEWIFSEAKDRTEHLVYPENQLRAYQYAIMWIDYIQQGLENRTIDDRYREELERTINNMWKNVLLKQREDLVDLLMKNLSKLKREIHRLEYPNRLEAERLIAILVVNTSQSNKTVTMPGMGAKQTDADKLFDVVFKQPEVLLEILS